MEFDEIELQAQMTTVDEIRLELDAIQLHLSKWVNDQIRMVSDSIRLRVQNGADRKRYDPE